MRMSNFSAGSAVPLVTVVLATLRTSPLLLLVLIEKERVVQEYYVLFLYPSPLCDSFLGSNHRVYLLEFSIETSPLICLVLSAMWQINNRRKGSQSVIFLCALTSIPDVF